MSYPCGPFIPRNAYGVANSLARRPTPRGFGCYRAELTINDLIPELLTSV